MPTRLRPKAPIAADAILVGDPGRALLLAQELLTEPKMSNHARGLWGYSGQTPAGGHLTVQATGMGGPSAAIVLADLVELGVRRAIRVGTCAATRKGAAPGALVVVDEALAEGGSAGALGIAPGDIVRPAGDLLLRLSRELPQAPPARVASFDITPAAAAAAAEEVAAADMQTVAVLAGGRRLGIPVAAVLIVTERAGTRRRLDDEAVDEAAAIAGRAASAALSPSS